MTMRKMVSTAVIAAICLTVLPSSAFAQGHGRGRAELEVKFKHWQRVMRNHRVVQGSVTAVSGSTVTVKAKDGTVYTVQTNSDTKIEKSFKVAGQLSDIAVNSSVWVKGNVNGNTVTASYILVTPANTHPASTKGTVTAVSGNTVTVQNVHTGVVSNVTVKTDSNTQVTKADGSAGATTDVAVGSNVKVKGLWDEVLNALIAFKIKIR